MKPKILAIPLTHNHPDAPLSERFGKTPYVALFDGASLTIVKNPPHNSESFLQWCKAQGTTHLLLKEYGRIPCACKHDKSVTLCYTTLQNPTLKDAILAYYHA
jgi:predicted Fe-Mo cluster-binding NifX family protein